MSIERHEPTPRPATLDVIKLNGRWAQYTGGTAVHYLDDDSWGQVEWDKLNLVKRHGRTISLLRELGQAEFSDTETARVHWGTEEQKKHPYLREQVTVFGEYESK